MGKAKSIICEDMEHCMVCSSPYAEVHHVIYGTANRKLSEKYGLKVPLCHKHHTGSAGVHFNRDFDMHLKKLAQERFEAKYGASESFREVFGRNYI